MTTRPDRPDRPERPAGPGSGHPGAAAAPGPSRPPESPCGPRDSAYDVVVCGAGVAGLAAARGLGGLGLRVLLVDKQRAPRPVAKGEVLQPGALRVLRHWGTEAVLYARQAVALDRLVVRDTGGAALMALDYGRLPSGDRVLLAHDHLAILTALAEGLAPGVEVCRGALVRGALRDGSGRIGGLRLADGGGEQEVRAPLVVGADGIASPLRRSAGIGGRRADYGHRLVSVEVASAGPPPRDFSAYLTPRGLRLVYPLPGGRLRLYLQTGPDELRGLSADGFARWLTRAVAEVPALAALGPALGAAAGSRQVFPVGRYLADRLTAPGLALLGEAVYAVHPMAAQGMNTAITSAASLTEALARLLPGTGAAGRLDAATVDAALRAYEAERLPVLARAASTSAGAARMVTVLSWAGRRLGRRAVRRTGANPRLLHTVTHNMAGLGRRALTPLDRLQQIGLLPDPRAHRVPADRASGPG